jgi:dTDP-glucose 4,6-dehydratase
MFYTKREINMGKQVLITGGAGFIGSNFVRYIFENYADYHITVIDALTYAGNIDNLPDKIKNDARFKFWYSTIRNADLVNTLVGEADVVIHFAAESHVARSIFDNAIFFETDVLGTQVVSNAVLRHKKSVERFIHISTSEVYGTALTVPMMEDHPLNPTSPYAGAKAGADRLVYSYSVTYDIPVIIIRPFNTYGPNQHLEKVIPRFITSAILDEPLTVHGSGNNTRDWLYVTDLCQALDKVIHADLEKVKGQVINLGTGKDTSINQIANMVLSHFNKPQASITKTPDRYGQVAKHVAGVEKARQILNWKATTDFNKGLTATIKWYEQNPEWWHKLLWMRHVPMQNSDGTITYY